MLEKLTGDSIEIQRNWLRFILERVGHNNLSRLIDYYKTIGWINASVGDGLLALSNQEKRYRGTSWTLSAEEHRISMLYIEKLKGNKVDDTLLNVSQPGRAKIDIPINVEIKPKANFQPVHPVEKKKMEFMIHRREVTIDNLEQELEEKNVEIGGLQERIRELEQELGECQKELMRNKIYMGIFDQNTRLRKADRKSLGKK
ncbi:Archaeal flagella protein [uncultured archaeon]|nr:Archaeal flagella protein [uncultured archaeon]